MNLKNVSVAKVNMICGDFKIPTIFKDTNMKVKITVLLDGEIYFTEDFSFTTEQELDNHVLPLEKNLKAKVLAEKIVTYSPKDNEALSPSFVYSGLTGNEKIELEIPDYQKFQKFCKDTLKLISSMEIITKEIDENS